jgi:hypothetical protein
MCARNRVEKIGFMSKNNDQAWKTKYGPRRVRQEAPTLAEAIIAAQGLSEELDEQTEIAAALMGLPYDEVRAALVKTAPPRKDKTSVVFTGPASAPRTIVVERKLSRRVVSAADRVQRPALNSAG